MLITYTRYLSGWPAVERGLSAGILPKLGQRSTCPPGRLTGEFIRRQRRRFVQPHPWPFLSSGLPYPLPPIPFGRAPRISVIDLAKRQRRFRQSETIAATGPGLTARAPLAGTSVCPRFTVRDLLQRQRHFRQIDPRGALSGLTARSQGSFIGAKTAYLTVTPTRKVSGFKITPTRSGTFRVQPGE